MPKIKKISKKDLNQYATLGANAFPGMGFHTTKENKDLENRLIKRYNSGVSTLYGSYDKNQMLGGIMLYDFQMNLFGHKVLCGGGGFLVISLLHKKQHIAKDLCQYFIKDYYDRGGVVAALYPFRPDFYRKMGFGYGSKGRIYNFAPKQLPDGGDQKNIKTITKKDTSQMVKCFNSYVDLYPGMFYDSTKLRHRFLRQYEKSRIVGYFQKNQLTGFVVFSFKETDPENFSSTELVIDQLVYLNREAFLGICGFLKRQQDQCETIQYLSFDDNFHYNLIDPRHTDHKFYMPVFHKTDEGSVGTMYRIINNKKFFETLKNHSFGNENLKLKLTVNDSFFKPNDGTLFINFENGQPELLKSANGCRCDVAIEMNIEDFSSMALGAVDFKSLYHYGRAEISNKKYIKQVNNLFKTETKPFCLTAF